MRKVCFEKLSEIEKKMLKSAKKALKKAYNPYSGFFVGAAVLSNGKIITGTNFESAAYGDSICAERTALLRANVMGFGNKCTAIAIIAKEKDGPTKEVTAPCGSCRQLIWEAAERSGVYENFKVIMATTNFDKIVVATIGELLPLAFGPRDLGLRVFEDEIEVHA